MKYSPTPDRSDDLLDIEDFGDSSPLPKVAGSSDEAKIAKKIKGPSPFNLKANQAGQNMFLWTFMGLAAWLVFPLLASWIEGSDDPFQIGAMAAAAGTGLGGVMLLRAEKSKDYGPYAAVHSFLFISLLLSLFGYIAQSVLFSLIGPLSAGFGLGSFLAVVYRAATVPVKPAAIKDGEDGAQDALQEK